MIAEGCTRLGWLTTAVSLEINGIEISGADNHAVHELHATSPTPAERSQGTERVADW